MKRELNGSFRDAYVNEGLAIAASIDLTSRKRKEEKTSLARGEVAFVMRQRGTVSLSSSLYFYFNARIRPWRRDKSALPADR